MVAFRRFNQLNLQEMRKVALQITILAALFAGGWLALSQVPWVQMFKVQERKSNLEKELGKIVWSSLELQHQEITDTAIVAPVDSILTKICQHNDIARDKIKLHILESDEVNAFALPDGYIVVFSGLIQQADTPEEIAGVISHEVAHIQLDHLMDKLVTEIGLATLVATVSGNGNAAQVAQMLASSAFSREAEQEADLKAVEYLTNTQVDAEALATFMYKMSKKDSDLMEYTSWLHSHPMSEERTRYILEERNRIQGKKFHPQPILSNSVWQSLKTAEGSKAQH